jgi:hypothetical protein
LEIADYQRDQKNKASCQSVQDVVRLQKQIQKQVKTAVLLINESVKLNLLVGQDQAKLNRVQTMLVQIGNLINSPFI